MVRHGQSEPLILVHLLTANQWSFNAERGCSALHSGTKNWSKMNRLVVLFVMPSVLIDQLLTQECIETLILA